ncbi:MAG: zinc metalloprotease HtpX [Nanoarchaeota archaeon]|nr:zinc metalloprotease HtpX [Nanoarchaeota archaeon]
MWNQVKTVLLLGILTALLLFIGSFFGTSGLMIALAVVVIMNFVTYFFSDKIVLAMYHAKEIPKSSNPKLHHLVEDICKGYGIPKPKIFLVPTDNPNAFATGRNPKHAVVAVTEGILHLLSDRELKGVLAHELGHVKNRDILVTTIAVMIAGTISFVASMARFAALFGGSRDRDGGDIIGLLVLALLAPVIALVLQLAIARSREYLADQSGASIIKDADGLASALQKLERVNKTHPLRFGSPTTASLFIVNPFTARSFATLFSTHPSTEDRVKRLRALKW